MKFNETKLWKLLKTKDKEFDTKISSLLENQNVMPKIEKVISKGNTSPKDFTLHDEEHSFRVAERMYELISDSTKAILSPYECSFMLLAAYLHDIGMSPSNKKIEEYRNYLLFSNQGGLSNDDIEIIEEYLFKIYGTTPFPLEGKDITDKHYGLANEILTSFCRNMHNKWSEDWIKSELEDLGNSEYPNWTNDLIKICKSHHYNLDALKKIDFNPTYVNNQVVHLRYIAICLRISDVLDVDPERTPEVILKHRNITKKSLIYWKKDHHLNIQINENQISLHANPSNAIIHKAIDETASQIEHELELCGRLIAEKPLYLHPPHNNLRHEWLIKPYLYKNITPQNNNYVYIDTSLKLNTERIIELLAGTQLYRSPLVAVREMLQNSFDAIKESIAYDRINSNNPNDEETVNSIRNRYCIELVLEEIDDNIWLSCKDNGIGMTKDILSNNFLISGSSKHFKTHKLEEECKRLGFSAERTGQFGIGILSYFMLTESFVVNTKRSELANDNENTAWKLEIPSMFGFGELKHSSSTSIGTEIRLKLKSKFVNNNEQFEKDIIKEISDFLVNIPCKLSFESKISGNEKKWTHGWVNNENTYSNRISKKLSSRLSDKKRYSKSDNDIKILTKAIKAHEECLNWIVDEGSLFNNLGYYKILIPYYAFPLGNSFTYIQIEEEKDKGILINKGKYFIPSFKNSVAWNGIKIKHYDLEEKVERPYLFLINFTSSKVGKISVSREELNIEDSLKKGILSFIEKKYDELLKESGISFNNSLSYFNLIGTPTLRGDTLIPSLLENEYVLKKISESNVAVPISENSIKYDFIDGIFSSFTKLKKYDFGYDLDSKEIPIIEKCSIGDKLIMNMNLSLNKDDFLFMKTIKGVNFISDKDENKEFHLLKFPPQLNEVCCIYYDKEYILNKNNILVSKLNLEYYPLSLKRNLNLILKYNSTEKDELLSLLMEIDPDFVKKQILEAKQEVNNLLTEQPEINILFNYCSMVDNRIQLLMALGKHDKLKKELENEGVKYYVETLTKLNDNYNIHTILHTFLDDNKIDNIRFIDFIEEDKVLKSRMKTIRKDNIEETDNFEEIKEFINKVDEKWKYEIKIKEGKR